MTNYKKLSKMKYKLTCDNKKCKYQILVENYPTIQLRAILKKCPVCNTKYKKNNEFREVGLTKKRRLKLRRYILRKCEYNKKRLFFVRFFMFLWSFFKKITKKVVVFCKVKLKPVREGEK